MTVELGVVLFDAALILYAAAAVCYVAGMVKNSKLVGRIGLYALVLGLLIHTASIAARTIATRTPPLLNMYEYVLALIWCAVVIYLILEWVTKTKVFGAFVVPLIAVSSVMLVELLSAEARPVMPALRSAWRVPHIVSGSLAYAGFGIAFCLAIMYLIGERAARNEQSFWAKRLPALRTLDYTIYRTVAFGFLLQTSLILTGALWAQKSWARYWGWDSKETWSLITWLVYAAYLHTRSIGWKGRRSAILAIIGFAVAMFTLFGVSYLLAGLHSYA